MHFCFVLKTALSLLHSNCCIRKIKKRGKTELYFSYVFFKLSTDKKYYSYMKEENKRLNEEENQRQLSIKNYEYIFNNPLSTLLIGLVRRRD